MLRPVTAIQFHKPMGSGKTAPSLLTCVADDGEQVELVAKFSKGCEGGAGALLREALTALIAADLDLPVPEPFLVRIEEDFAATIPRHDERYLEVRRNAAASIGWNFGSRKLPSGYSAILKDRPVSQVLLPKAAEILAFDTFIANPDRTVANPNCLTNGREFAIFDHELAFHTEGLIGWKPPWEEGGISFPKGQPERIRHVFLEAVRGSDPNFSRLSGAFDVLTDERLAEYAAAIPPDWSGSGADVQSILDYVRALKSNISAATLGLGEALR